MLCRCEMRTRAKVIMQKCQAFPLKRVQSDAKFRAALLRRDLNGLQVFLSRTTRGRRRRRAGRKKDNEDKRSARRHDIYSSSGRGEKKIESRPIETVLRLKAVLSGSRQKSRNRSREFDLSVDTLLENGTWETFSPDTLSGDRIFRVRTPWHVKQAPGAAREHMIALMYYILYLIMRDQGRLKYWCRLCASEQLPPFPP